MARDADRTMKDLKDVKKRLLQAPGQGDARGRLTREREAIKRAAARWWGDPETSAKAPRKAR